MHANAPHARLIASHALIGYQVMCMAVANNVELALLAAMTTTVTVHQTLRFFYFWRLHGPWLQ
jgi:hypothetical protein